MATHKWRDVEKRAFTPRERAASRKRAEQEVFEMNLRKLRELVGKTQADLGAKSGMNQSELSRMERRQDHMLSTLRRYVESLGGKLEILAVFDDKMVKLVGV